MNSNMEKATLFVVSVSVVIAVSFGVINYQSTEELKTAMQEGNKDIHDELSKSSQQSEALLEHTISSDFNPELEYWINGNSFNQKVPNTIRVEIKNLSDDHTFVKNRLSFAKEICNDDGTSRHFDYDFAYREELELVKDEEKYFEFTIPNDFFEIFPEKRAFLLQLELEMNPYTHAAGPTSDTEIQEMTYIKYDLDEERNGWMVSVNPTRGIDCTSEPAIFGRVIINTSSMYHFADHSQWWTFPEA